MYKRQGEDGDVQEVVVGMIVPGGRCELLVQEVAADHESLVALHLQMCIRDRDTSVLSLEESVNKLLELILPRIQKK